jgi:hypothetical protein
MTSRLLRLALFATSCVLAAAAAAFALWHLLPYELLRRATPEDQFLVWEAATWLLGLCLVFFGAAAALDSLDLYQTRVPGLDEVHSLSREARHRRLTFRPGSLWTVSTGAILLLLAAWVRLQLVG